jgi:hypothetical protein
VASYISRNYLNTSFPDPSIDEKIEVFEDRVIGWQIEIAETIEKLIRTEPSMHHAGYALVSVLFSCFEMMAQFIEGKPSDGGSKKAFVRGFKYVYPGTKLMDAEIEGIYSKIRCGMYHDGHTKFGTLISSSYPDTFSVNGDTTLLNPHKLVADVKNHFQGYVSTLKDKMKTTERNNFEATYDGGMTASP